MDFQEKLCLQHYYQVHPLNKKKIKTRRKYCKALTSLVTDLGEVNPWSQGFLKALKDYFVDPKLIEDSEVSFKRFFLCRYVKWLFTDLMFVSAFDSEVKADTILDFFETKIGNRKRKSLLKIRDAFYGKLEGNIVPKKMRNEYEIIQSNRSFEDRKQKNIMITANMSAGKSTLVNALVGKRVSKTMNDACTSKIHYLFNKAGEDGLTAEWDYDFEIGASLDILMNDNERNSSQDVCVGTRFRSLSEIDERVCFIDTPGVNSSQNQDHRDMTDSVIENEKCDLLLYVLNGENIGTDDDKAHMVYVTEHYKGKVIFLVNKLDRYKKDVDSVPMTVETVKEDLKKMGYEDAKVYPVSAYAAYLAKMSLYNESLSEDETDDLQYEIRKLGKEEFQYNLYYPKELVINYDSANEFQTLLAHSGLLSLEKIIYQEVM